MLTAERENKELRSRTADSEVGVTSPSVQIVDFRGGHVTGTDQYDVTSDDSRPSSAICCFKKQRENLRRAS